MLVNKILDFFSILSNMVQRRDIILFNRDTI